MNANLGYDCHQKSYVHALISFSLSGVIISTLLSMDRYATPYFVTKPSNQSSQKSLSTQSCISQMIFLLQAMSRFALRNRYLCIKTKNRAKRKMHSGASATALFRAHLRLLSANDVRSIPTWRDTLRDESPFVQTFAVLMHMVAIQILIRRSSILQLLFSWHAGL